MRHSERGGHTAAPTDLVYLPDPMGRLNRGKWVRRGDPRTPLADNPDATLERLRSAWRQGQGIGTETGELFRLDGGVGPRAGNGRLDVAKAETLLESAGVFDLSKTGGPTGTFSDRRAGAIREFQKKNGLKADGLIAPNGETLRTLRTNFLASGEPTATGAKGSETRPAGGLGTGKPSDVTTVAQAIPRRERINSRLSRVIPGDDGPVTVQRLELSINGRIIRPKARSEIERAIKHKGTKPLLFKMEESRRWAILNNRKARFNISDNPKAKDSAPVYAIHEDGVQAVRSHSRRIEEEAATAGVDPSLVKAIMYVENAHGKKYGILGENTGISDTILPMNVSARNWGAPFGVSRKDLDDPRLNIRAGIKVVKNIVDRLDASDRTPAKIASLYNGLARENVNDYGARVARVLKERLWRNNAPP